MAVITNSDTAVGIPVPASNVPVPLDFGLTPQAPANVSQVGTPTTIAPTTDPSGGTIVRSSRRDQDNEPVPTVPSANGRRDRDNTVATSGVGSALATLTNTGTALATQNTANGNANASKELRVRITPLKTDDFFGSGGIMAPVAATNGVLFPYSPQISFEQSVEYDALNMVHVNTDYLAYKRTPSVTINIVGKFTCQTQSEGRYALAVIHFFRTASKMYFGEKAGNKAGLPPPILQLSGYGVYMFNKLNCVLKSHSFSYSDTMDTVSIDVNGDTVRLPAMFDITCALTVQQTPQQMRNAFDLDAFRTGALMKNGGWI